MIEVCNISKKYGTKLAVDDLSFQVQQGEILGFLGPNGAGKSTTMNIITGYISATHGSVTIDGVDIFDNPSLAKSKIGYLPEQPPLYLDMTVIEYLTFVYEIKKVKLVKKEHLNEILNLVKLSEVSHRLIKNLSKGYRQRVGIAGAMIGNPKVLILDEPTVGLDPLQIIEIRSLIKSLGKQYTVILSSHILPEIQAVCQRVVVIHDGKLVADDTTENLSKTLSGENKLVVRICGELEKIKTVISNLPHIVEVSYLGEVEAGSHDFTIESLENTDVRQSLFYALAQENLPLLGLKNMTFTLEDIFLKLTHEKQEISTPVALVKHHQDCIEIAENTVEEILAIEGEKPQC
ncbi:MAG: ATP-binding cassette domain-containing protein [Oscillospiraceae bacterium]